MKKKMKRFENGGSIDEGVRARAMKSVEGLEGIKGSDIEDETGTVKGSIKRNEYGDLYDSEMKASVPKKTAEKLTPKAEAPTPKAEPKAEAKEKANPVQQLKDVVKGKDVTAPSAKSFTEAGGNTKARTQKVDASELGIKAPKLYDPLARFEQTGPKRSEAAAPKKKSSYTADHSMGSAMRKGGAVRSSASKRADGCAIRGKTRA